MAKRERPLVDDSRKHHYTVHLTDDEMDMLSYIVNLTGKKRSEVFRTGLEDLYYDLREKHKV